MSQSKSILLPFIIIAAVLFGGALAWKTFQPEPDVPIINDFNDKKENNKTIYKPGRLKKVKAIGWYIKDFNIAQVSINLIDYKTTPLHTVFETTKEIANNYGLEISGSELIGLIPLETIIKAGIFYSSSQNKATENELIQSSIKGLGLSDLSQFEPNKRILEFVINR